MTPLPEAAPAEHPLRIVYVVARDAAEARRLGEGAVRRRLAACENHWPIRSTYWWNGRLEHGREVGVLLKTTSKRLGALFAWLAREHSYEVPDIVELCVLRAHEPYVEWLVSEVEAQASPHEGRSRRATRRGAPKAPGARARRQTRGQPRRPY